ncbi:MAG TPA: transcriptional regulator [Terriglobia bacterium]|nr:transcriptional regulator [Terriglobia bacterium]
MTSASFNWVPALSRPGRKVVVDTGEYQDLLHKSVPRVIRTESENEHYLKLLEQLDARGAQMSSAEKDLAELLTLLIEDFEERRYKLKPCSPIEVLQELLRANGLKQKDLLDVFGTPSIVSEVMGGKRQLTTGHIRKLSQRFRVSPELFL